MPIVSCLLMTGFSGKTIGDVCIASSSWNDEMFYFKQVEGIVSNGIPAGFFGYNESAANLLSFGAWSPVILIPWAAFGKVFGWNLFSPIAANILFLSAALFSFAILSKPDIKKTSVISVTFLAVTPFSRYMFSVMPEIILVAGMIVLAGIVLGYGESKSKSIRLVSECVIIFLLTSVRPYFAVLFVFPLIQGKVKWRIVSFFAALGSVISYFLISKFFCAPYFTDLFSTEWIDVFVTGGIVEGFKNFFGVLFYYIFAVLSASARGVISGYGIGIYFAAFLILLLALIIEAAGWLKKDIEKTKLMAGLCVSQAVFFVALILMYSLGDGFRHLFAFIVISMLFVTMSGTSKYYIKESVMFVVLLYLFAIRGRDAYYFGIPYDGMGVVSKEEIVSTGKLLEKEMIPTGEISFDNDVIVLLSDKVEEETVVTDWQYSYAVPKGFGYSICTSEYVIENIGHLKSRYIILPTGGATEKNIAAECAKKLITNEKVTIYRIR